MELFLILLLLCQEAEGIQQKFATLYFSRFFP
jgi:hypothetical protein